MLEREAGFEARSPCTGDGAGAGVGTFSALEAIRTAAGAADGAGERDGVLVLADDCASDAWPRADWFRFPGEPSRRGLAGGVCRWKRVQGGGFFWSKYSVTPSASQHTQADWNTYKTEAK